MAQEPQRLGARRGEKLVAESGADARSVQESSPTAWHFGATRPATPQAAAFRQPDGQGGRQSPAAAASGRQHPHLQQHRAATAGTPSPARAASGSIFRSMRTNSGSLTGLLRRPGSAAPAAASGSSSPVGAPLFEVRGASMLPPEVVRPGTAAQPQSRPGVPQHKATAPHAYNLQAHAGPRTAGPPAPHAHAVPQRQPTAVVASHGLDLGSSPAPAPARAAGAPGHRVDASAAEAAGGGAQHYSATYSVQSPLVVQGSGSAHAAGSQAYTTTVHQNPLYAAGSESFAGARQKLQQRALPAVRVLAGGGAASTPPSPQAGASLASAGATPAASPHAHLQAASNLTVVNDSRPISPGPFLSTLASSVPTENGSRPVSPQCMDNPPPTPGSYAPAGGAAAALATRTLTPVKTLTSAATAAAAAQAQSRSVPVSPAAAMAAVGPPSAAGLPAAAAAFRVPIFNQDGRLVGYKQNSNLIPRPGACVSSAPSSPSRSTYSDFQIGSPSMEACSPLPAAPAVKVVPSSSVDFQEFASDPCKGFSDADNVVPGYVLGPVLGKGGFCSVRKALHELTGQAVACKIIEKGKLKDPKDRDRVDRECRVMRNLSNHTTIIKLYENVETRDYVYIMMETAKQGSLLDYVREKKKLPEPEAVTIFQQLLHSLQFCHRKDVVHRDIKLENILIDAVGHMKLIDFGLCGYYVAGKRLRCHCGSPSYAAPEIVARKDYLGPPVDVWSLGIVLFAMLAGYLPFHAKEKKQLSEKILAGVYKPAAWMSAEAQDLIARMLTLDPDQRITLEEAWAHPWVASAPRWEPPGVGAGRLYRSLTEPITGAMLPDEAVLAQLEALGADTAAVRRALRSRDCNSLTATYNLMLEAHIEAQKQAAVKEREAAAERATAAVKQAAAGISSNDWQWDFAAISAAAAAGAAANGGSSGGGGAAFSQASSGSSSLRANSSPARPRTVVAPSGSPTRFGQEAAAAGYMSPIRPSTAAAVVSHGWTPYSSTSSSYQQAVLNQQQREAERQHGTCPHPQACSTQQQQPATTARQQLAEREAFTIKAVHHQPGGGTASVTEGAAGAAVGEQLATGLIITATTVMTSSAEIGSPSKSPRLSPLPTVLSPKQLGGSSGGDHSPLAQLV